MDWNLLFCFVWINFVFIQTLRSNNNVDLRRLIKYLHRKKFESPFNNEVHSKTPLTKNDEFNKDTYKNEDKRYYAIVNMHIINGKPRQNVTNKLGTYHGNEKYSPLRNGKRYKSPKNLRINDHDSSGEGKKLKTLLFAEEISNEVDDDNINQDNKKLIPGNTLIQLENKDLASAAKFPVPEKSSLVYGNLENLGITYGKTNQRLEYSNFRKSNNLIDLFNAAVLKPNSGPKKWIVLEITPNKFRNPFLEMIRPKTKEEEENDANEILDEYDDNDKRNIDYRRKKKSEYRKREEYGLKYKSENESSESSSSSSSGSMSSNEKNPGNPYTLHKGKYKQNFLWNHFMDGDHMNINPYSPLFNDMAATGQDLYFGRKWWYFNQDDYKPMG